MSRLELFLNGAARGSHVPEAPSPGSVDSGGSVVADEPIAFHRRLPCYAPTPLVEAPSLAARLGVGRVLVKDESSRLGLPSFKVLGASWAVYRAVTERAGASLEPWDTLDDLADALASGAPLALSAATDGNHGRAVARMARLLGLACRIYVPANTTAPRIGSIQEEGASCTVVDGSYDDAVRRSAADAAPDCLVISDTSWPGYTSVPGWVIDGYSTILREIDEQLEAIGGDAGLDVAVVPIGVGALAAAVVRHFAGPGSKETKIIGVEPLGSDCVLQSARAGRLLTIDGPQDSIMSGLNCGTPSEIAFPVVSSGVELFLAIDDEPVRRAMRDLASVGIVSGETGAAALAGVAALLAAPEAAPVRERLGLGSSSTILLLSTEGATDPVAYREIVGAAPHEVVMSSVTP